MNIQEIRKLTKGKKLSFYDSWNSHQIGITIETAHRGERETIFSGINQWGKNDRIYITNHLVDKLLRTGEAQEAQTIEYCTVIKRYRID